METRKAITALAQSEKIKSGIIWATHAVEIHTALPDTQKPGAAKLIRTLIEMIAAEIFLARRLTGETLWMDAEKDLDMARVMIDSGVVHEAGFHLTQALTRVTSIGQRAMTELNNTGLL
jgi:hypothetical protein